MGLPEILIKHFGMEFVMGRSLVAWPAANITPTNEEGSTFPRQ